jgi:hypothetical protein
MCSAWVSTLYADSVKSPFNGLVLDLDEAAGEYSFLVGGHLYGEYGESVFPSSSLLANLDRINASGAKFFVSLGDNFRKTEALHISNYLGAFAAKLQMPLFNAVGNTDVRDRELYEARFGETFYSFVFNDDQFVFLDGELNEGSVVGDQLKFLTAITQNAVQSSSIRNVFIFSHRWIWAEKSAEYKTALQLAGYSSPENNFRTAIAPLLIEMSDDKKVFWVSGENGAAGTLPLFYEQDPENNITYLAVGIGDTDKDALLRCTISPSKEVTFAAMSLTGHEVPSIDAYDAAYWHRYYRSDEPLLSRYWGKARRMLQHVYFWTGVLVSLPVVGLILLWARRRQG